MPEDMKRGGMGGMKGGGGKSGGEGGIKSRPFNGIMSPIEHDRPQRPMSPNTFSGQDHRGGGGKKRM